MTDETSAPAAGDLLTDGSTDPGAFASRIAASLPFNRLVGLRCNTAPAGSTEVVLPADERLANHLGSVHAVAELAPADRVYRALRALCLAHLDAFIKTREGAKDSLAHTLAGRTSGHADEAVDVELG